MSSNALLSWGRYPRFPQSPHDCFWRDSLPKNIASLGKQFGTTLAYGSGRSYGDSCLAVSDQVLAMRQLNRFIAADWEHGVLRAEAGVTLAEVLSVSIPRGWFLPVAPGTKFATLGGALANDVHGKNHHRRGTFGCHVKQFGLVRSDRGNITCSQSVERELFAASIGGLGLTGIVEWVELQLIPLSSTTVDVLEQRFETLDDFFALSDELDRTHEFSVSWLDCAPRGKSLGRGIFTAGNFSPTGKLEAAAPRTLQVPVTPPISLINRASLGLFNSLYWRKASKSRRTLQVGYESFLFPLDAILQWNRIYGARGFQQYQALLPERDARDGVREMLSQIAKAKAGSFLSVLKRCGDQPSPGLLSFPQPGITLALDFPQHDALNAALFARLDAIVRAAGGRLYPAKDAHMSGEDFRRSYPNWRELETNRDPVLLSRFWKRVTQ